MFEIYAELEPSTVDTLEAMVYKVTQVFSLEAMLTIETNNRDFTKRCYNQRIWFYAGVHCGWSKASLEVLQVTRVIRGARASHGP